MSVILIQLRFTIIKKYPLTYNIILIYSSTNNLQSNFIILLDYNVLKKKKKKHNRKKITCKVQKRQSKKKKSEQCRKIAAVKSSTPLYLIHSLVTGRIGVWVKFHFWGYRLNNKETKDNILGTVDSGTFWYNNCCSWKKVSSQIAHHLYWVTYVMTISLYDNKDALQQTEIYSSLMIAGPV